MPLNLIVVWRLTEVVIHRREKIVRNRYHTVGFRSCWTTFLHGIVQTTILGERYRSSRHFFQSKVTSTLSPNMSSKKKALASDTYIVGSWVGRRRLGGATFGLLRCHCLNVLFSCNVKNPNRWTGTVGKYWLLKIEIQLYYTTFTRVGSLTTDLDGQFDFYYAKLTCYAWRQQMSQIHGRNLKHGRRYSATDRWRVNYRTNVQFRVFALPTGQPCGSRSFRTASTFPAYEFSHVQTRSLGVSRCTCWLFRKAPLANIARCPRYNRTNFLS